MAKVEIYIKQFCPYCTRAMKLLAAKGVSPETFDVTMGGAKKAEMVERSGGRMTMPQVFIDGKHIGGSDDLAALDAIAAVDVPSAVVARDANAAAVRWVVGLLPGASPRRRAR